MKNRARSHEVETTGIDRPCDDVLFAELASDQVAATLRQAAFSRLPNDDPKRIETSLRSVGDRDGVTSERSGDLRRLTSAPLWLDYDYDYDYEHEQEHELVRSQRHPHRQEISVSL